MIRAYYLLTKPGIIYGNALTAAAGFFLASRGMIHFGLFIAMLVGLSFIIAASCVFNNILDRNIDAHMERTKNRALVTKLIPVSHALLYGITLGIIGSVILFTFTNNLTLLTALFGMFFYVVVYGIAKRNTVHGTLIGCISGAMPPVVGYVSVTHQLDIIAVFLFFILVFWQMPHFYAIALFRLQEYKNANMPVWPVVNGKTTAKQHIIMYVIGFLVVISMPTLFHVTGYTYLLTMLTVGFIWLVKGIHGLQLKKDFVWAKSMFGFSLVVLLVFSVMISLGPLLP